MKEKEAKLREQITENFPTYQNDEAALELAAQALEEYEKHGIHNTPVSVINSCNVSISI